MGYLIPRPARPMLPVPKPLPAVPEQRVRVVFCNAAAVEAVANLKKGEVVSCDTYNVRPIKEAR